MKETQPYNENSFPWHKVSSEWNALAMDDTPYRWYLFNSKPLKGGVTWWGEVYVDFDETNYYEKIKMMENLMRAIVSGQYKFKTEL